MDRKSIGNTIMLKEYTFDKKTVVGDIIIPDIIKKEVEEKYWEVVNLGTGEMDSNDVMIPFKVDIGDILLIHNDQPPTTAVWDGEKVLIVNQEVVLAKLVKVTK